MNLAQAPRRWEAPRIDQRTGNAVIIEMTLIARTMEHAVRHGPPPPPCMEGSSLCDLHGLPPLRRRWHRQVPGHHACMPLKDAAHLRACPNSQCTTFKTSRSTGGDHVPPVTQVSMWQRMQYCHLADDQMTATGAKRLAQRRSKPISRGRCGL
jgi:hypothetical protein